MSRSQKRPCEDETTAPARKKPKAAGLQSSVEAFQATAVKGDVLRWKVVTLPERLEDAEGFFGLEEIEGVEVVKDEQSKNVLFRAVKQDHLVVRNSKDGADEMDAEGGWTGFEDEETNDERPRNDRVSSLKSPRGTASLPSREKKSKDSALGKGLHFDVLQRASEEVNTDVSAWRALQLSRAMLSAIAALGFPRPTPIQIAAIPPILEGHDVIGKAVTGSGKTLAFGIPIYEEWLLEMSSSEKGGFETGRTPTALVLAPTRELAHQLANHLTALGKGLDDPPRIAAVTGGLSILKQRRQLETADIVIGTPGRLWEVISDVPGLISKLKQVKFLVVDEADRLLSEGHFKEVEDIMEALDRQEIEEDSQPSSEHENKSRQTLVFSATFHKSLQQKLAGKIKKGGGDLLSNSQSMEYLLKKIAFREAKPTFIDMNPASQMASALKEAIVECGAMEKDLFLYALVLQNPRAKTLVFTNSISSVKRLTPLLQNLDQPSQALHSTMPQKARLRSLERFSTQRTILVATDVAARGLDIKGIDLIIHYHVPRTADMYVHRSGRTARAENVGRSILICSPDELASVMRLVSKVHEGKSPEAVSMDRNVISKLAPRISLSQKITEATSAREKSGSQDGWLRTAAEELGIDYDSEEFANENAKMSRGRGKGKHPNAAASVSKAEIASMRSQLKDLLSKRINLGISEKYLAGGKVDINAMLEGTDDALFLKPAIPSTG